MPSLIQVKVVWHQAVRIGFGYRRNVQLIFFQKKPVVLRFLKYIFKPVGMVVNMKTGIRNKRAHMIKLR
jgi:hypothetical protein